MGLGAAALAFPTIGKAAPAPADRPNILFIMSDDHAAHAIGAYGGRLAKLNPTPVIDGLAREGMLFENAFVTNSICVPSRACIMTGQYSHVNGALTLGGKLAPEHQYLAIEMKKAGCQTAMIGKWHLKLEPNFDYYKVLPGQGSYFDPTFREKGKGTWPSNTVRMKGHSSDCITDSTLAWLKSRDKSRPFFLMHHYKAPHDMFSYAKRYESYLAEVDVPEPKSLWEQPRFGSIATRGHNDELVRYIGTSIGRRHAFRNYTRGWAKDPNLSDERAKRQAYQTYLKKFLRCVKGVDDNLKRLLAYLRDEGILDDTVIIYTGDQGMMLGEHDYQDKRGMYDESQRMPFIVRYPKSIKPGSRTDAIVENVDFGPTMLDFAGVKTPDYMQGRSFKAILETGKEPPGWKQAAYYRYWMHMAHHWNPAHFGIRTKRHKLIFYYGCDTKGGNRTPPGWELYDLQKDPHEVNNVYDDPAYKEAGVQLKKQLADLRRKYKDTDEAFPEVKKIVEEFWDYDEEARRKAIEISHQYAESAKQRRGRPRKPGRASGGWIKAQPSKVPRKKFKGYKEISRDAPYRMSHPGSAAYNLDNAFLTSGEDPKRRPHAFHSAENADRPHIVIKLDRERTVRYLKIRNRLRSHQGRARDLAVWVSRDNKSWKELWRASSAEDEWIIGAGEAVKCRYIKIGLRKRGTLHLNKVIAFGE